MLDSLESRMKLRTKNWIVVNLSGLQVVLVLEYVQSKSTPISFCHGHLVKGVSRNFKTPFKHLSIMNDRDDDLDRAFNWLVVLLSVITATIAQFPRLMFPSPVHENVREFFVVRFFVFPILVLIILWLYAFFATGKRTRGILKLLSWMFALIILSMDMMMMLITTVPAFYYLIVNLGPPLSTIGAVLLIELLVPIPLYVFVIYPRMNKVYPDSALSLPEHAFLLCVVLVLFFLSTGLFEMLLGIAAHPWP